MSFWEICLKNDENSLVNVNNGISIQFDVCAENARESFGQVSDFQERLISWVNFLARLL